MNNVHKEKTTDELFTLHNNKKVDCFNIKQFFFVNRVISLQLVDD